MSLHRSLQNGRQGEASDHSTGRLQVGQETEGMWKPATGSLARSANDGLRLCRRSGVDRAHLPSGQRYRQFASWPRTQRYVHVVSKNFTSFGCLGRASIDVGPRT